MEMSGQRHVPAALSPEKEPPGTHWIGGGVDPRTGLDIVSKRKILSPQQETEKLSDKDAYHQLEKKRWLVTLFS